MFILIQCFLHQGAVQLYMGVLGGGCVGLELIFLMIKITNQPYSNASPIYYAINYNFPGADEKKEKDAWR